MPTKEEVRKQVMEMIQELPDWLPGKVEKLFRSGAVDFNPDDHTHVLAKEIMCALGREIEHQHIGPHRSAKHNIANLYANM